MYSYANLVSRVYEVLIWGDQNGFYYRLEIYNPNMKDILSYVFCQLVPHFPF